MASRTGMTRTGEGGVDTDRIASTGGQAWVTGDGGFQSSPLARSYNDVDMPHFDLAVRPRFDQQLYDGVSYRRALICMRFDHGKIATYLNTFYPLLKARQLPHGLCCIPLETTLGGDFMTYAQYLTQQQAGVEIQNHSYTHYGGLPAGWADYYHETVDANTEMIANNLFVQSFVQPGGWKNDPIYGGYVDSQYENLKEGRLLRANFAQVEGYVPEDSNHNINSLPFPRHYGVTHVTIDAMANAAAAQVFVDNAIRYGGAVFFNSENGIGGGGSITLAEYTTFLTYLQTQRDLGTIDILTPTASVYAVQRQTPNNILFDGGFELQGAAGALSTPLVWRMNDGFASGIPTLVATPRSGVLSMGTDSTHQVGQIFLTGGYRTMMFDGWARATATATTARVQFRLFDAADANLTPSTLDTQVAVTNAGWTRVRLLIGNNQLARWGELRLFGLDANQVLWDDCQLYKV